MPGTDAKWIIGTLGGLLVVLGGLIIAQNAGLRADIAELRTDFRRLDDRVRAVEIALGKVEQRLETLERIMLPAADPADQDEQEQGEESWPANRRLRLRLAPNQSC